MKNILIPTTFEHDTLNAVKTAIKHAKGNSATIILMTLCEAPDTYSASEFLRNVQQPLTAAQSHILDKCATLTEKSANCSMKVHKQPGLTAPLFRNLLEYLSAELIIITPSYKAEKARMHQQCLTLIAKCKIPILHTGQQETEQELTNALYLENSKAEMSVQELQHLLNGSFSFRIVGQAQMEEQNPNDMGPFITDAIARNNVDLLIETRKPHKNGKKGRSTFHDSLGLPVLSLHEEALKA